jgi:hypothetical protein
MLPTEFVYLGVLLVIIGNAGYIYDTIKGKTKPNRVTWLLWSLAPLIAFAAMVSKGVGKEALATLVVGLGPATIFVASFFNKQAEWKLEKFDLFCGAISIIGLILWLISKEGNVAIFFSIVADFAAALPTVKKAYTNPETESSSAYTFSVANALIALLVIKVWNFENYGFMLYWIIMSGTIAVLVLRKRFSRKH